MNDKFGISVNQKPAPLYATAILKTVDGAERKMNVVLPAQRELRTAYMPGVTALSQLPLSQLLNPTAALSARYRTYRKYDETTGVTGERIVHYREVVEEQQSTEQLTREIARLKEENAMVQQRRDRAVASEIRLANALAEAQVKLAAERTAHEETKKKVITAVDPGAEQNNGSPTYNVSLKARAKKPESKCWLGMPGCRCTP